MLGWVQVENAYPDLNNWVLPFLLAFPTWLIKAGFSAVNVLDIENRGDLHLKLNRSLSIELEKLLVSHQEHPSHRLIIRIKLFAN